MPLPATPSRWPRSDRSLPRSSSCISVSTPFLSGGSSGVSVGARTSPRGSEVLRSLSRAVWTSSGRVSLDFILATAWREDEREEEEEVGGRSERRKGEESDEGQERKAALVARKGNSASSDLIIYSVKRGQSLCTRQLADGLLYARNEKITSDHSPLRQIFPGKEARNRMRNKHPIDKTFVGILLPPDSTGL